MADTFFSWIIDRDIAVKEIDKSVVEHHGTGIPYQTRRYWNCEALREREKKKITLNLYGIEFLAHIEMRNNRTRLFWMSDFRDAAGFSSFSDENIRKLLRPYLLFKKYDDNRYNTEVISQGMDYKQAKNLPENTSCFIEGKKKIYYSTKYERNGYCRAQAIKIHGCKCSVCGFDFETVYGKLGIGYTEIHHRKPLHSLEEEMEVNPEADLVPVCSNCHRMLHRRRDRIITIEELRNIVNYQATN